MEILTIIITIIRELVQKVARMVKLQHSQVSYLHIQCFLVLITALPNILINMWGHRE